MGLVNAEIILKNPRRPELEPVKVSALADTASVHLCIPPDVQIQLELEEIDKKEATLADGSRKLVLYVDIIYFVRKGRFIKIFLAICVCSVILVVVLYPIPGRIDIITDYM